LKDGPQSSFAPNSGSFQAPDSTLSNKQLSSSYPPLQPVRETQLQNKKRSPRFYGLSVFGFWFSMVLNPPAPVLSYLPYITPHLDDWLATLLLRAFYSFRVWASFSLFPIYRYMARKSEMGFFFFSSVFFLSCRSGYGSHRHTSLFSFSQQDNYICLYQLHTYIISIQQYIGVFNSRKLYEIIDSKRQQLNPSD